MVVHSKICKVKIVCEKCQIYWSFWAVRTWQSLSWQLGIPQWHWTLDTNMMWSDFQRNFWFWAISSFRREPGNWLVELPLQTEPHSNLDSKESRECRVQKSAFLLTTASFCIWMRAASSAVTKTSSVVSWSSRARTRNSFSRRACLRAQAASR